MQEAGYCECGCGELAPIARQTRTKLGHVRGLPVRYISGHNGRSAITYRVEDRGHDTPCWIWLLGTDRDGYGKVRDGERHVRAHRRMYEQHSGPIPPGLTLDHLCRIHACVNPDHLEPVTATENTRRGNSAKLTLSDANEIRRAIGLGVRQRDLAWVFGVAESVVSEIKADRAWAV